MSSEEATEVVRAGQAERSTGRFLRLALPTAAVLGVGAATGIAAIPSADGTITACYAGPNGATINQNYYLPGTMRIIDPSYVDPKGTTIASACQNGETKITWNDHGPVGPTGPAGVPGATGASGPQGPAGQAAQAEKSTLVGSTAFGLSPKGGTSYLKFDGVEGESTQKDHKGEIELESVALGGGTAAKGTGKATLGSITFTKKIDKASPVLFAAAATGKHFPTATIVFARKAGGKQQEFLKIKLTDILISSVSQGTASDGTPLESVTLATVKLSETFLGKGSQTISITPTAG